MHQRLSLTDIVERDPDVIDAVAGDDIVMVRLANGSYYGVSEVSRRIWERLKTPVMVSQVIASLIDQYDVEPGTCERETLAFLERMLGESLIRVNQ